MGATTAPAPKATAQVSVAVVALTVREGKLAALLLHRDSDPYAGSDALPRADVTGERCLADTASAVVAAVTGASSAGVHLEQLGVYERERPAALPVLDIGYRALAPHLAAGAAGNATWADAAGVPDGTLAFDDARLLADAVERTRAELEYAPVALSFCPAEFTVGDLRRVYEAVWGVTLDAGNFHRKVTRLPGFLEPTGRTAMRTCGRPGQTYRAGPATRLTPPLLRAEVN